MSMMSHINLARKNGEKVTRMLCGDGEIKYVCTDCLASSSQKKNVHHSVNCEHFLSAEAKEEVMAGLDRYFKFLKKIGRTEVCAELRETKTGG